jgi:hypothetical protein
VEEKDAGEDDEETEEIDDEEETDAEGEEEGRIEENEEDGIEEEEKEEEEEEEEAENACRLFFLSGCRFFRSDNSFSFIFTSGAFLSRAEMASPN